MPTYVVTAPDGKQYEITAPEGATQEQVLEYAKQNYSTAAQPKKEAEPQKPASVLDQMFGPGSPIARFAKGAVVDPLLGVNQMLANTGIFGQTIKQGANQLVKDVDTAVQQGRQRVGSTGFDFAELAGAVLSPANKVTNVVKAPATLAGRVGTSAGLGTVQGLAAPTVNSEEDSYVTSKLLQAGFGAVLGGGIPATGAAAKKIADIVRELPISEAAKQRALQNYVRDLIPEGKKDEIVAALKNPAELVSGSKPTAGQTLSETPFGVGLIKEQERVSRGANSGQFLERSAEQQKARIQSLTDVLGDDAALEALIKRRTEITTPLREKALADANVYGQQIKPLEQQASEVRASMAYALQGQGKTATEAAQAIERANNWSPVAGFPQFPGRYSPNTERAAEFKQAAYEFGDVVRIRRAEADFKLTQAQQLKDSGYYPLDSTNIIDRLEKVFNTPGERSNDLLVGASKTLINKLQALTDENGIINSVDLYNVRKNIAQDIGEFLKNKNASFGAEAAKVDKALKNVLDAAINKASGSDLWSQYLSKFADYSKRIDQAETGKLLRQRLGENSLGDVEKAGKFADAVLNAPATIRNATGGQRYGQLSELLTPDQNKAVNAVLADLSRGKKAEELGKAMGASKGPLADVGNEIPQFLDNTITLFRTFVKTLKAGGQKELDSKITSLMLNPQELGLFIESIPKAQAKPFAEAVMSRLSPNVAAQLRQVLDTTNFTAGAIQQGAGEF
jgi:hypothetical protein